MMVQAMEVGTLSKCAGSYLKRELKSRKITQEGFALMIGTEPRTVRRWIRDGIHKLEIIEEIARTLNVSVWDILAEAGMSPLPDNPIFAFPKRVADRTITALSATLFLCLN